MWLKRIRGAIGTGVTWAVGWALAGLAIGVSSLLLPGPVWDAFFAVFDAPLPALAVPGFFGGLIFSVVLGVAARHRRIDELPMARVMTWGALGGALLSLVPGTMVALGLATIAEGAHGVWQFTALIGPPLTLSSALSAGATLWMARRGIDRAPREADNGNGTASLLHDAAPAALGSGDRLTERQPVRPDKVNARP
jgi:hypothetical protein